jgi:hypothetical protein
MAAGLRSAGLNRFDGISAQEQTGDEMADLVQTFLVGDRVKVIAAQDPVSGPTGATLGSTGKVVSIQAAAGPHGQTCFVAIDRLLAKPVLLYAASSLELRKK